MNNSKKDARFAPMLGDSKNLPLPMSSELIELK